MWWLYVDKRNVAWGARGRRFESFHTDHIGLGLAGGCLLTLLSFRSAAPKLCPKLHGFNQVGITAVRAVHMASRAELGTGRVVLTVLPI